MIKNWIGAAAFMIPTLYEQDTRFATFDPLFLSLHVSLLPRSGLFCN